MKKISLLLVISIIALMFLSACGTPAKTDEPQDTSGPQETEAVASEPPEAADTSYDIENVGEKDMNDKGEVIGDCHFQKVVFTNPNAALKKINKELAELADDFFEEGMGAQYQEYFKELPDEAKAELAQYPYVATYDVESINIDENYVWVNYVWDWYAGGVHNYGSDAYGFNIKTGEDIDFVDLFASEADAREAFRSAVNALIDANPEAFFEDAKETVENYDLDNVKFTVSDDKITVFIDQYEIAPGASGSFTVEIVR